MEVSAPGVHQLLEQPRVSQCIAGFVALRERLRHVQFVSRAFHRDLAFTSADFSSFVSIVVTDHAVGGLIAQRGSGVCELNLAFCSKLSNQVLRDIAPHLAASLTTLNLEGNFKNFQDSGVLALVRSAAPRLQHLNLSGCSQLSTAALSQIVSACPVLRYLNVSNLPNMTGAVLLGAAAGCPVLEAVAADCCAQIGPTSLIQFIDAAGARIKSLSFQYSDKLNDAVVQAIWNRCANLESLSLYGCSAITDRAFINPEAVALPEHAAATAAAASASSAPLLSLSRLSAVDVSLCVKLTDASMCNGLLLHARASLRRLALFNCANLSDHTLRAIAAHAPHLAQLNVQGCPTMSDGAIQSLRDRAREQRREFKILGRNVQLAGRK